MGINLSKKSVMKLFAKIIKNFSPLILFVKNSFIDVKDKNKKKKKKDTRNLNISLNKKKFFCIEIFGTFSNRKRTG